MTIGAGFAASSAKAGDMATLIASATAAKTNFFIPVNSPFILNIEDRADIAGMKMNPA